MLIAELIHVEVPQGPALPFLVLLVVVVFGPMIIERFRVPGIIGLLVGGLLVGLGFRMRHVAAETPRRHHGLPLDGRLRHQT